MDYLKGFELYLQGEGKSENTIQNYLRDLKEFVQWYSEKNNEGLNRIIKLDVQEYKKSLQSKGLKITSINRKLATLNAFLKWMSENNYIEKQIKVKHIQNKDPLEFKGLDRKDLWQLRKKIHREGNKLHTCIFELLLNTGIRVSELCDLTLDKINISERKGEIQVKGKGNALRTISLNKDARGAIKDYLDIRPTVQDNHLLIGQRGALKRNAIDIILKKYGKEVGLDNVSAHMLRHTLGHKLVNNPKVAITTIQGILGHKKLDTVMIYTQTTTKEKQEALDTLEW